ncbi:MAG: hypothetical protein NTW79_00815 [Candidatus Berkelbacteria bacterium]|nr:hypothetical protein [Candidatus Berkelbacteria bacterium]
MPIVTNNKAIINMVQPLLSNQIIEAVALISTEPTAGGIAKEAVNSGIVGGLLSSVGLGRATEAATDAVNNTEGSAVPHQYYLIVTNSEIVFATASVIEPAEITNHLSYADIVSVEPGTSQLVFTLKTGKTFKYLGGGDTIDEVAQTIQRHLVV